MIHVLPRGIELTLKSLSDFVDWSFRSNKFVANLSRGMLHLLQGNEGRHEQEEA